MHAMLALWVLCVGSLTLGVNGKVVMLKAVASTRIRALDTYANMQWGGGSKNSPVGLRSTEHQTSPGQPFEWFLKFDLTAYAGYYFATAALSVTKCRASSSCASQCRANNQCSCPIFWAAMASCGGGNIDSEVQSRGVDDLHLWQIPNAWDDSWTYEQWKQTWNAATPEGVEQCCNRGAGGSSKMEFAHYLAGQERVGEGTAMFDVSEVLQEAAPGGGKAIRGGVISLRLTVNGSVSRFFVPVGGDPAAEPYLLIANTMPPTTTVTTTTSTTSTSTSTTSTSTTSTSTTSTSTSTTSTSTTSTSTSTTSTSTTSTSTSTSTTSTSTTSTSTSTTSTSTSTTSTTLPAIDVWVAVEGESASTSQSPPFSTSTVQTLTASGSTITSRTEPPAHDQGIATTTLTRTSTANTLLTSISSSAAARGYNLSAILAVLEFRTEKRWDALQSWIAQAIPFAEDAISRRLKAPQDIDGQRIVVVTGASISSSEVASKAEVTFRAFVPAEVHVRRLAAAAAADLDDSMYEQRLRAWENIIGGLTETTQFQKGLLSQADQAGMPVPPGLSILCRVLGRKTFDEGTASSRPEFVFQVLSGSNAEQSAAAASAGLFVWLPVVLVVVAITMCMLFQLRCFRRRFCKLLGKDLASGCGAGRKQESGLRDFPFTPSPPKRNDTSPTASGSYPPSDSRGGQSGSRKHSLSDIFGNVSVSRQPTSLGSESGSRERSEQLTVTTGHCELTPCQTIVTGVGSYESDDLDVCSFTSSPVRNRSPCKTPRWGSPSSPNSPDVRTPFQRVNLQLDSPLPEPRSSFCLEDLSPGPASQLRRAALEAGADAQEVQAGLSSIFEVQPPQPPRHKFRPKAVGPPLSEALEELVIEDTEAEVEGWRFGDWVSFSPLRRRLGAITPRTIGNFTPARISSLFVTPSRVGTPGPGASPPRSDTQGSHALSLSPAELDVDAGQEVMMPNIVASPARHRIGRPRALDGDFFDEAEADTAAQSRSNRSTPHPDICLQVASTPKVVSTPPAECGVWFRSCASTPQAASTRQSSPYRRPQSRHTASRPAPTALSFAATSPKTELCALVTDAERRLQSQKTLE